MAGSDDDRRDGARSGVWKMVYADFTTAMMAFFLVMWLASTASEAQRDLLADYFNPISISREQSGADGVLNGRSVDTEGALQSEDGVDTNRIMASAPVIADIGTVDNPPFVSVEMTAQKENSKFIIQQDEALQDRLDQIEAQLRLLMADMRQKPGFTDVILIERKPTEIEIQVSDHAEYEMFTKGSARLRPEAQEFFTQLGWFLSGIPCTVRISGHTDSSNYRGAGSNWELSAERANAARRTMELGGLNADRIASVEGRADRDLLTPDDPLDPRNRRISVNILANVSPSSDLLYGIAER